MATLQSVAIVDTTHHEELPGVRRPLVAMHGLMSLITIWLDMGLAMKTPHLASIGGETQPPYFLII